MKHLLFFLSAALLLTTAAYAAADRVPLATNLQFPFRGQVNPATITFVASPEISQLVVEKKKRLLRMQIPFGNAAAVNTENALRSAFAKVRLARSTSDVDSALSLEAKSFEVTPAIPWTVFSTYGAKVRLVFVLRDTRTGTEREIVVEGDGEDRKNAGRALWEAGRKWTETAQLAAAIDMATIDALDKLLVNLSR